MRNGEERPLKVEMCRSVVLSSSLRRAVWRGEKSFFGGVEDNFRKVEARIEGGMNSAGSR